MTVPKGPVVCAFDVDKPKYDAHHSVLQKIVRGGLSSDPSLSCTNCLASEYKSSAWCRRSGDSAHTRPTSQSRPAMAGNRRRAGGNAAYAKSGVAMTARIAAPRGQRMEWLGVTLLLPLVSALHSLR